LVHATRTLACDVHVDSLSVLSAFLSFPLEIRGFPRRRDSTRPYSCLLRAREFLGN